MLGSWATALARGLRVAAILAVSGLAAAWWTRILSRRPAAGDAGSVRAILDARPAIPDLIVVAAAVLLVGAALVRRRALIQARTTGAALLVAVLSVAAALASQHGHHAVIVGAALFASVVVVALWPGTPSGLVVEVAPPSVSDASRDRTTRRLALLAFALVAGTHAFYSMHRHAWFGSGSWDAGCMVHNLYRASRFLEPTSTVLGDVDFLGDHFMVGLYLFAPLAWIHASAYTLLAVQSASLAAVAPVVLLLLVHRGAPRAAAFVIAVAAGLAFGLQSAAYFDIHEITVGFGFLAGAVLFLERRQLGWATVSLVAFSLFKESLGAYVVGLGLLLLWRGIRDADRRQLVYGGAWVLYGAVWFVLVNRVFMPALIARANRPEPHETFGDFGPTVFTALVGILSNPVASAGAIFVPSEKVASLLVTFGGLGFLAFARPELTLPALPLLAERFLSSKTTMWEMGYHYAAPLTFYAAWAVAVGWPVLSAAAGRVLRHLTPELEGRAALGVTAYVLTSALLINAAGYRHPANYLRLREGYFSTPARRASNAKAVALLEAQGREARLAVQNRILPHLADRPFIWRLGEYEKADFVLLNVAESAWPYDDGYPRRLAAKLARDWRLVFSEGETAVFARPDKTSLPEVSPSPALGVRGPQPVNGP